MSTAKQAIILARVSSKEQEEGYSIDAQKHRLEQYCLRKGLTVIKKYDLVESSTIGDRKKFMQAIQFLKSQTQTTAIVTDKVDRLQRSFKETPLLDDLINQGRLELHFHVENCIIHKDSTSQERLMWNMHVVMAQSYVDSLRDNVKRSIEQKLRHGEWIGTAPIGYLNIKGLGRKRGKIILDPERALLIKRLFEEYATGQFTLGDMVAKTKQWGLRNSRGHQGALSKSHIHKTLTNPFYYGVMRVLKTGKEYPHIYEPIITKEVFDACQVVRRGWKKKPFQYGAKEYVFRGLIKCATTGRTVTAETQKRTYKNGTRAQWTYLRTWNPDNPQKKIWVREDKVLKEVEAIIAKLHIEPRLYSKIIAYIKQTANIERSYHKEQIHSLHREHENISRKLDKLMDFWLEEKITEAEHEAKREKLIQRRDEINALLTHHDQADDNFTDTLITLVNFASNAHQAFKGSTTQRKRRIIHFTFSNLELKGTTLCFTLKKPFDEFVKCRTIGEWRARKDSNLRPPGS
ncbi:MAG: recombinase family protein [Legionellales bacterium]|nr:recombinase family protein [Legionellales bacterium]